MIYVFILEDNNYETLTRTNSSSSLDPAVLSDSVCNLLFNFHLLRSLQLSNYRLFYPFLLLLYFFIGAKKCIFYFSQVFNFTKFTQIRKNKSKIFNHCLTQIIIMQFPSALGRFNILRVHAIISLNSIVLKFFQLPPVRQGHQHGILSAIREVLHTPSFHRKSNTPPLSSVQRAVLNGGHPGKQHRNSMPVISAIIPSK